MTVSHIYRAAGLSGFLFCQAEPHTHIHRRKEKGTHELIFHVNMASVIKLLMGTYVSTTVDSRNMAAILQLLGLQRTSMILDIHVVVN